MAKGKTSSAKLATRRARVAAVLPILKKTYPQAKCSLDHHNPLDLLVKNLELRARLDDADREALLALPYTVKTLEPATYTLREGDAPVPSAIVEESRMDSKLRLTGR